MLIDIAKSLINKRKLIVTNLRLFNGAVTNVNRLQSLSATPLDINKEQSWKTGQQNVLQLTANFWERE